MAFDAPLNVSFEDWAVAATRATPLVGVIIITWAACEATMNTQVMRKRQIEKPGTWPKLSHKFKERLNEWIRLCLIPSGATANVELVREDLLRLQTIRNNLAHNITAMWIDTSKELRVFCTFENKNYEAETKTFDYSNGADGAPLPISSVTYSGDGLLAAHNEMRKYLALIGSLEPPNALTVPRF